MSLLFSMLPIYLFGNLHCLGMCGPLVMMIGRHRYRLLYFLGRTLSFTLAGTIAGAIGSVANAVLKHYHLLEGTAFFFGTLLIIMGIFTLTGYHLPLGHRFSQKMGKASQSLSLLMLRDSPWPTFLFGFFTLALPCGQTLIVFSACALSGDPLVGMLNGFAFAILTSPSLFVAMQAHGLLQKARKYYRTVIGISALVVGMLAILRGLAEVGVISHWVLNAGASEHYHLVIF